MQYDSTRLLGQRFHRTVLRVLAVLFAFSATAPYVAAQTTLPAVTTPGINTAAVPDQTQLFPSTPETVLMPGDQVSIRLYGESDYTVTGRIEVDGSILLPLIGLVNLRGLTVNAAGQLIAQRLEAAGMYRNPQVIIQLLEGPNSIVTLAGEMHAVVPVVGSRNLYAVIAAGGGLPSGASRTVTIVRPGQAQPMQVDIGTDPLRSAASNIPLFPGDTVVVSRVGLIYVMGEFRNPTVVPLTNYGPLTLTQVSAMVGGPIWDAKYGSLHIIRTVGDHRTVTTLNIKNVLYGHAPDPIMQPNDIVFLPPSGFKSSLANGSLGSILGVFSFALSTFLTFR